MVLFDEILQILLKCRKIILFDNMSRSCSNHGRSFSRPSSLTLHSFLSFSRVLKHFQNKNYFFYFLHEFKFLVDALYKICFSSSPSLVHPTILIIFLPLASPFQFSILLLLSPWRTHPLLLSSPFFIRHAPSLHHCLPSIPCPPPCLRALPSIPNLVLDDSYEATAFI